jgi:16S rRNA processing protein RimM
VTADRTGEVVIVGTVTGLHGVRGWLRVISHTRPAENLGRYVRWRLDTTAGPRLCTVLELRPHGGHYVARLEGCDSRNAAATFVGADIAVSRADLPPLRPDEYYWSDLAGLRVRNRSGVELGTVARMLETGGADVMVIEGPDRTRLVPFVPRVYVTRVDTVAGEIEVDWHPED